MPSTHPSPNSRALILRISATGIVALVWTALLLSPRTAVLFGLGDTGLFFDLRGSLAAGEAARQGLDAYAVNPLDPYGRPHFYSSWWLVTGWLGLTRADANWLGPLLLTLVLGTALAVWPLQRFRDAALAVAILVSPTWLLAASRANNDLVIFVLFAAAVGGYQSAVPAWRVLASALTGLLTVLKYFPVAAIIGVLGAPRRREVLILIAVAAGVVAAGLPSLPRGLEAVFRHGPEVNGLQGFGATLVANAIAPGVPGLLGLGLGLAAALAGFLVAHLKGDSAAPPLGATLGGASLIVCFFLAASFNYKLIFLWWWLPWLLENATAGSGRRRFQFLLALLLWAHWADGLTMGVMNWFGPEWSVAQRTHAVASARYLGFASQLVHWALIGVALRLAIDWCAKRRTELATRP